MSMQRKLDPNQHTMRYRFHGIREDYLLLLMIPPSNGTADFPRGAVSARVICLGYETSLNHEYL